MKKAIELQFHWIFVLIAGAIILAFFFTVVQKQREYAEQRISIRLSADVEELYSAAIESKGSTILLPTPRPGISFYCSRACECNFGIGNKVTEFRDKIIFAPDFLEEYDTIAWALEWKQPFRVTNFLYLTNEKIKYYLVYSEGGESERLFRIMNKALPENINLEVISDPSEIANILPAGWQETKLVFLGIDPYGYLDSLDEDWIDERLSVVQISPPSQVIFFEKEQNSLDFTSKPSVVVGEPTYYAAMFASDQTMYDCGLETATDRLANVGRIVRARTAELEKVTDCTYFTDSIDSIITAAEDPSRLLEIGTYVQELERQNKQLIREGCPEMY